MPARCPLSPMMKFLVSILLFAGGVVNSLPAAGLAGARMLDRLYGINVSGPDMLLLLRHRAVLLLVVGAHWRLRPSCRTGGSRRWSRIWSRC